MWASNNRTYYGTATGATVYGIDGMLHQFNAARHPHCLCVVYPPIYGFESASQCSASIPTMVKQDVIEKHKTDTCKFLQQVVDHMVVLNVTI